MALDPVPVDEGASDPADALARLVRDLQSLLDVPYVDPLVGSFVLVADLDKVLGRFGLRVDRQQVSLWA